MSEPTAEKKPGLPEVDVHEYGGKRDGVKQALNRRLFMQLLVFDVPAGASAPEVLVNEVIDAFRARYEVTLERVETAREDVEFKVPRILREPA